MDVPQRMGCECEEWIRYLTQLLHVSSRALARAVGKYRTDPTQPEGDDMAKNTTNPVLQQLADQVTATVGVEQSAVALINGFNAQLTAAVAAAIANGATAAELQPITDELTAMKASADALALAVAANTPVVNQTKK